MEDGVHIINLEYVDIGTHWIALYVNVYNGIYFDSFGIEHIPKEVNKFISNKNITSNFLEYKHII